MRKRVGNAISNSHNNNHHFQSPPPSTSLSRRKKVLRIDSKNSILFCNFKTLPESMNTRCQAKNYLTKQSLLALSKSYSLQFFMYTLQNDYKFFFETMQRNVYIFIRLVCTQLVMIFLFSGRRDVAKYRFSEFIFIFSCSTFLIPPALSYIFALCKQAKEYIEFYVSCNKCSIPQMKKVINDIDACILSLMFAFIYFYCLLTLNRY